jgi:hypothetical protein
MEKRRDATLVIVAGGFGLLVGRVLLAKFPGSDMFGGDVPIPQVWTKDADLRLSLALNLVLLGLAGWHFIRFGLGKLLVIGLLAAGALQFTIVDFGDGDLVWSEGYSGDELVGVWLIIASAVVVLLAVVWSFVGERPASVTFSSYFFSEGPAGSNAQPAQWGAIVDEGQSPPEGWWLSSDGKWYPPEQHPDYVPPPPGPNPLPSLRLRGRWVIVIGAVVGFWIIGQIFFSDEVPPLETASDADDQGSVQDEEWGIELDGDGVGIHILHMTKTFSPVEEAEIEDLGGRLVWEETEIELCALDITYVGDGFVQIGNGGGPITEECDTGIGRAFDDFGLPESACVFVQADGVDDEYCAPLTVD